MAKTDSRPNRPIEYDERVPDLFVPDLLLASQYADRRRPGIEAHSPERRLMAAVLEDAIHVYRTHAATRLGRHRGLFDEAEAWIESQDRGWLFSFESVCDHLGLEPDYLRRGLRAHKARLRGFDASSVPTPVAAADPIAAAGADDEWLEASGA